MLAFNLKRALRSSVYLQGRFMITQQTQSNETDLDKILKLPDYSAEQRTQILHTINNNAVEELLNFDITKSRACKLHNWKTRNGPLRELSDILYVEGFGLKVVNKFYQSLLSAPDSRKSATTAPMKKRSAPFTMPTLDESQRQNICSSLALRIGASTVSWARLELPTDKSSPTMLTHWQQHELNDKKLHLSELAQRCIYVAHQIPNADCYILENPQMAQASSNPGSIDQQNVNIQKAQITAMFSYALMARAEPSKLRTNLFYMRRFLAARLFNHLVGTERVSSEDTVIAMMRTFYNLEDEQEYESNDSSNLSCQVQFPTQMRDMFANVERFQRELLGQALLLNLAFVRLVLLQDAESIASVSKNSKRTAGDTDVA